MWVWVWCGVWCVWCVCGVCGFNADFQTSVSGNKHWTCKPCTVHETTGPVPVHWPLPLLTQHLGVKLPASAPVGLNVRMDGVRKIAQNARKSPLPPKSQGASIVWVREIRPHAERSHASPCVVCVGVCGVCGFDASLQQNVFVNSRWILIGKGPRQHTVKTVRHRGPKNGTDEVPKNAAMRRNPVQHLRCGHPHTECRRNRPQHPLVASPATPISRWFRAIGIHPSHRECR